MIFVITKDFFLAQGISHLRIKEETVRLDKLSYINLEKIDSSTNIIIDTYHNNILDEHSVDILKKIDVGRVIILAPFHISKLKSHSPLFFVNRKKRITELISLIFDDKIIYKKQDVVLSHNQLKLVNSIINQQSIIEITQSLNITEQTIRIQKFNIMLKLKLRRIIDVVTLKISPYF